VAASLLTAGAGLPNTTTTVSLYRVNGVARQCRDQRYGALLLVQITLGNNGDNSAIYTAISTTVGYESGALA